MERTGLKQIVMCNAGTMLTTPVSPLAIGLRNAATMERTPHAEITDYRGRKLRNMTSFKIDAESLQATMQFLKALIGWTNLNCDSQIITREANEVYQFASVNKLGLDFEYLATHDKVSLKAILEGAFPYAQSRDIINSAKTNTAVSFTGITGEGADFTKYNAPYFTTIEAPQSTALFSSLLQLSEISLSIKSKNKKSLYNSSMVDYVTFEIKVSSYDSGITKQLEIIDKDVSPSIKIKKQNSTSSLYDMFDFAAGVLTLHDEHKNTDEERTLPIVFSGDVPVNDISFLFGASNGGDAADTVGAKGGTMKIGY